MNALSYDVLTDAKTDLNWVRALVEESTKAGYLRPNNDHNLATWVVACEVWTLDPEAILGAALAAQHAGDFDPLLFAVVPLELRDDNYIEADSPEEYEAEVASFARIPARGLAQDIADELVREGDDCPDLSGNLAMGKNTVPIIVVHHDTTSCASGRVE